MLFKNFHTFERTMTLYFFRDLHLFQALPIYWVFLQSFKVFFNFLSVVTHFSIEMILRRRECLVKNKKMGLLMLLVLGVVACWGTLCGNSHWVKFWKNSSKVETSISKFSGRTKWVKTEYQSFSIINRIIPNWISRYINLSIFKVKLNFWAF